MTEDRLKAILERIPKKAPEPERTGPRPDKRTLKRLYLERSLSIREIAAKLGLHPHTIHYHLRRYGIAARPRAKRSELRKIRPETLAKNVTELGVRGYASKLGIHENTLRDYLKRLKTPKNGL